MQFALSSFPAPISLTIEFTCFIIWVHSCMYVFSTIFSLRGRGHLHSPLYLVHFLTIILTANYKISTMWCPPSLHMLFQALPSLQVFYSQGYQWY